MLQRYGFFAEHPSFSAENFLPYCRKAKGYLCNALPFCTERHVLLAITLLMFRDKGRRAAK